MTRAALTVDDLDALSATGRLGPWDASELVAGVLWTTTAPSAGVLRVVADLAVALHEVAHDHRVHVRPALVVGPCDLLRPAVVLLRPAWPHAPHVPPLAASAASGRGAPRAMRWPAAGVALAVFVGEDEAPLRWRTHRCAQGGVREVWTIALDERRASRWRAPADGRYTRRDALPPGEPIAPDALPGHRVVAWR